MVIVYFHSYFLLPDHFFVKRFVIFTFPITKQYGYTVCNFIRAILKSVFWNDTIISESDFV